MHRIISNLRLCQPTLERAENTCGPYWFLITSNNTNETAFCTRSSFVNWLTERKLALSEPLKENGAHDTQIINGTYEDISHISYDDFYNLTDVIKETRILSNGTYTLGFITEVNNIRQVHHLNPNCHYRPVFDYAESEALIG
jgi:hypothetical protein